MAGESGGRAVTIGDVAQHAGVSVATVSRALTGARRVSPALVERIRSTAEALGYLPNEAARNLRLSRTMTLGAMFGRLDDPMLLDFLEGLGSIAQEHGYSLVITTARGDAGTYRAEARRLFERRVDGLLLTGFLTGEPDLSDVLRPFARAKIPVLAIFWRGPGSEHVPLLRVDHDAATLQAMRRLAELGHQTILYLVREMRRPSARALSLRQAASAVGLRLLVESVPRRQPEQAYQSQVARWLARPERPTALITDQLVLPPLVQTLNTLGIAVPADLSLVTFGELNWLRGLNLPWATIRTDMQAVGRAAGRLITAWLDNIPPPDITSVAVDEWIERGSIGPAPAAPPPPPP